VAIQLVDTIELHLVVKDLLVYLEQYYKTDEELATSCSNHYKDNH